MSKPVESLEHLHSIELEALCEIARVCDKHGIRWFLHGGTLLGAIREGGPLAWDDDVDIAMLAEDFGRFRDVAAAELAPRFKLTEPKDFDVFFDYLPRVTDLAYSYVNTREDSDSFGGRLDHPDIDIFVLEKACSSSRRDARQALKLKVNYAKALGHRPSIDHSAFGGVAKLASYALPAIGARVPLTRLVVQRERLAKLGDSSTTLLIPNDQPPYWHLRWDASWYDGLRVASFSSVELPVPVHAEAVLENIYGKGWRTPPPASERVPQHASLL